MPTSFSSSFYAFAADLVFVAHFAFVLFVVVGLLLILVGGARGWRWVRVRRFRLLHLSAIAIVVVQSWLGFICPLTTLEMALRAQAGQATYAGSFISHWLGRLLYIDAPWWLFVVMYTVFAALVVASWWWVRPEHAIRKRP